MKIWVPALLVCLVLGCSPKKKEMRASPPVPVEVVKVVAKDVPLDLPTIGSAEAMATVQLKARVQGEITKVHFTEGSLLKQGDLLFSIDPRPFDVAISRAEANLASARANFENADQQLARYASLTGQGAASKEQLAQFRSTADALRADMQAKQADLEEAKLSREWTQIYAPISGRIGAALFKEGSIVQANGDSLAVINQIQPIHVAFSLPESDLPEVRTAFQEGSLTVIVRDSGNDQELGKGNLDFIDNTVDRDTGTIALKARLENEKEILWPGQFVDILLRLRVDKDCLLVPTTAIMDGQDGARVLVVEDGKANLRKVEINRSYGKLTLLKSGVAVGETVISSGQLRVSPGAQVIAKEVELPTPEFLDTPELSAITNP